MINIPINAPRAIFFLISFTYSFATTATVFKAVDFNNYEIDSYLRSYTVDDVFNDFGSGEYGIQYGAWGIFPHMPSTNIDWSGEGHLVTLGKGNTFISSETLVEQVSYSGLGNGSKDQSLMVHYQAELLCKERHGVSFRSFVNSEEKEMYLSYDFLFHKNFDFVKSGKIPGLCGGMCNSGGQTPTGYDGWSLRPVWIWNSEKNKASLRAYLYYPDQPGTYGRSISLCKNPPEYFIHETRNPCENNEVIEIVPGDWHSITMRAQVNSGDDADGEIDIFLNGEVVGKFRGIRFRYFEDPDLLVRGMLFDSCFGGRDDSYRSAQNNYAFFDNFILSNEKVNSRDVFSKKEFSLGLPYPNPVNRSVHSGLNMDYRIHKEGVEGFEIQLVNQMGVLLKVLKSYRQIEVGDYQLEVHSSELLFYPRGMYFLVFRSKGSYRPQVVKVIIGN